MVIFHSYVSLPEGSLALLFQLVIYLDYVSHFTRIVYLFNPWNPKKQSNLIEQMWIEQMWYHILYKYHESSSLDIGQWWWNYA